MEISVVIPVYNSSEYIEKCARSLFGQTFESVEYIFVDDCSTDNSVEIVRDILTKYPQRTDSCKFLCTGKNSGPSAARNMGLQVAGGKYVLYFDSDDWADGQMLEKMHDAAERSSADIVLCDFYIVYAGKCETGRAVRWTSDRISSMGRYLESTWTVVWNLLVKRELYIDNNISFPAGVSFCEDFNVSVKLLDRAGTVVNVESPLYFYNRLNAGSIVNRMNEKTMKDEQMMYSDIIEWFRHSCMYSHYEKPLSWRVLKSKQEFILDKRKWADFLSFYPESHRYVLSCPFLNLKLKLMMWCVTHRMGFVTDGILHLRNLKNKSR